MTPDDLPPPEDQQAAEHWRAREHRIVREAGDYDVVAVIRDLRNQLYAARMERDEVRHLLDGKSEEYEQAMHRISKMEAAYTELRRKLLFEVGFMPPPVADSVCTALADFKDVFILANGADERQLPEKKL